MTTYKIKTDDGTVYVTANLVEASAPITTYFGSDPDYDTRGEDCDDDGNRWAPTPYQTADARHREDEMAKLVADYCDLGEVHSVVAL